MGGKNHIEIVRTRESNNRTKRTDEKREEDEKKNETRTQVNNIRKISCAHLTTNQFGGIRMKYIFSIQYNSNNKMKQLCDSKFKFSCVT